MLTSAQFSELFKLPIVAEHFDEHQTEDANLTIWEFISIHYMHGEVDDDDFDKRRQYDKSHQNRKNRGGFLSNLFEFD